MSLIERMLKYDNAVYWAPLGRDKFNNLKFDQPVEIKCRWEEGITIRRDPDGTERIFNATVFVDRDLDADGRLFHGKLTDIQDVEDPSVPPEESKLILQFNKTPDLRYRRFLRIANV